MSAFTGAVHHTRGAFLIIWVDITLFGHNQGADQISPEAEGAAEEGDDPAHPHQGGVDVEILRDAAAHTAQHLIGALGPVQSLASHNKSLLLKSMSGLVSELIIRLMD